MVLGRLMETRYMVHVQRGLAQKRTNGFYSYFCLGERCPSSPALKPDNLFSPFKSLSPFQLLPWHCNSVQVSSSMSKSIGKPFKWKAWDPSSPPSHLATISADFHSRSFEEFSFWHWKLGLGILIWGWDSSLLWGTSAAKITLPIFNHLMWDQPIPHLCPSCQSWGVFFCMSLVIKLLFGWTSENSRWWLFCRLSVILIWSWEEANTVFTYSAILTGSPS